MTTQHEIVGALRRLSTVERWHVPHHFADELWADWDQQIAADLKAGRLDAFLAGARADIAAEYTN